MSVPADRAPVLDPAVLVAFGEFWLDPADQDALVAGEAAVIDEALAVEGMLSINFHRGLDGTRVVNLAQLASPATLDRLASAPTFAGGTAYWRQLARNEFHLYDVTIAVEPHAA